MIRAGDLVADIDATDTYQHSYLVGQQSIRSDSSALDALKTMTERQADALLVMQDDQLMGIVSETDFVQKVVLQGKYSDNPKVDAIMAQAPDRIDAGKPVEDCLDLMNEKKLSYLCVTNAEKILGLIHMTDVMRAVAGDRERRIRDLKYYILTCSETG